MLERSPRSNGCAGRGLGACGESCNAPRFGYKRNLTPPQPPCLKEVPRPAETAFLSSHRIRNRGSPVAERRGTDDQNREKMRKLSEDYEDGGLCLSRCGKPNVPEPPLVKVYEMTVCMCCDSSKESRPF